MNRRRPPGPEPSGGGAPASSAPPGGEADLSGATGTPADLGAVAGSPASPLAILAGGKSTRMGRDKLLLPVAGEPQLRRLVRLGAGLGLDVLVCGRPRSAAWDGPAATWLADAAPDAGPLAGLAAALAEAARQERPGVVLVAGDLPWLSAPALAWLAALPPGRILRRAGRIEPLAGHYPVGLLAEVRERLAAGRRSVQALAAEHLLPVEVPADQAPAWEDADTVEQWPC